MVLIVSLVLPMLGTLAGAGEAARAADDCIVLKKGMSNEQVDCWLGPASPLALLKVGMTALEVDDVFGPPRVVAGNIGGSVRRYGCVAVCFDMERRVAGFIVLKTQ